MKVLSAVRQMVNETDPHFICLQEARPYIEVLERLHGFTIISPKGSSGEAGDSILLLKNEAPFDKFKRVVLRMKHTWTGPKAGKFHHARIFVGAEADGMLVISDHRTRPGWSDGGIAFQEEYEELAEVMLHAQNINKLKVAAVGDQNIGTRLPDQKLKYSPYKLAGALGGTVITRSAGLVDSAIVGEGIEGSVRELGHYGSDHSAFLFNLQVSV
jgi:hypothetical protein